MENLTVRIIMYLLGVFSFVYAMNFVYMPPEKKAGFSVAFIMLMAFIGYIANMVTK